MDPVADRIVLDSLVELEPLVIYRFGSRGAGQPRKDSDLDIAILCQKPLDAVFLFDLGNQLSNRLGMEVDLLDLSRASTVMAKEVLRTGQRIQVGDLPAVQQFEMLALSNYARLNEERAAILAS